MMSTTTLGVEFQEGWARSAYFGVSASTGALTDFHDIISIKSYNVCMLYDDDDDDSDDSDNDDVVIC